MATQRRKDAHAGEAPQDGLVPLQPVMPIRLLPYDWPFLYSVLANGDLVTNKRLPSAPAKAAST